MMIQHQVYQKSSNSMWLSLCLEKNYFKIYDKQWEKKRLSSRSHAGHHRSRVVIIKRARNNHTLPRSPANLLVAIIVRNSRLQFFILRCRDQASATSALETRGFCTPPHIIRLLLLLILLFYFFSVYFTSFFSLREGNIF